MRERRVKVNRFAYTYTYKYGIPYTCWWVPQNTYVCDGRDKLVLHIVDIILVFQTSLVQMHLQHWSPSIKWYQSLYGTRTQSTMRAMHTLHVYTSNQIDAFRTGYRTGSQGYVVRQASRVHDWSKGSRGQGGGTLIDLSILSILSSLSSLSSLCSIHTCMYQLIYLY
jgi:hypothetical protein